MIVLVLGSSSTYSPHINHSGQDSLARTKNSNTNPVGKKCRLQTADRVRNADYVQNVDCRLGTKCRLRMYIFSWSSTFRGIHTLICAYVPYIVIGLHEEPPHKHTHTNKKDTACLITSAHPTSSQHNLFSNSHHDECTSFLNTQLRKNKIKFIPKVWKVHINRI